MDTTFETKFDLYGGISTDELTATATEVDGGVEIAVTDKNGTTTGIVRHGADGKDGNDGADGKDGTDGKSAYAIAVENGFEGTEEEWLASLKGDKGESGEDDTFIIKATVQDAPYNSLNFYTYRELPWGCVSLKRLSADDMKAIKEAVTVGKRLYIDFDGVLYPYVSDRDVYNTYTGIAVKWFPKAGGELSIDNGFIFSAKPITHFKLDTGYDVNQKSFFEMELCKNLFDDAFWLTEWGELYYSPPKNREEAFSPYSEKTAVHYVYHDYDGVLRSTLTPNDSMQESISNEELFYVVYKGNTYWLKDAPVGEPWRFVRGDFGITEIIEIDHSGNVSLKTEWNDAPTTIKNVKLSKTGSTSIPAAGSDAPAQVVFTLPSQLQADYRIDGVAMFEIKDASGNRIWANIVQSFTMANGTEVKVSFMGATNAEKTAQNIDLFVIAAHR